MSLTLKKEIETNIQRTDEGVLVITQEGGEVSLSGSQVQALESWLKDGNGVHLEFDWNNGWELSEE